MDKPGLDIIISGCLKNDSEHKKAFYVLFAPHMLSVSHRYARNKTDAEDIFQESVLNVFNNLHQLRDQEKIEWWMKRIVINQAIQFYRKNKNLTFFEDNQSYESSVIVSIDILKKIEVDEVLDAIQQLPDKMRLVINLFAIEGLSHEEIAEMLSISVGTSKSNLFDARKRIKLLLKENVRRIV
ncbi:MAG: RNA polymerase sigma factor [Paludibacter sp.]